MKSLLFLLLAVSANAMSTQQVDNDGLDHIYRLFMAQPVELDKIASHYRPDVIHVGKPDAALLQGKEAFMQTNIVPFANMLADQSLSFSLKVYVVRRLVTEDMANDVGYLYSKVVMPDGQQVEQVQKFSWVFTRADDIWLVATDFDRTLATLEELQLAIDAGARLID